MTKEIADFVKAHKAKHFPKDVKDPVDEKKSGDLGGYDLGTRDPESDKLAKKHFRHIHGSREGNKDPKDGVKDSLHDPKNKRLKGRGRNEKGDSMYEEEELEEKHWIQNAIKHPGALTRKAHKAKESPMEYAHGHEHSGGKTGKQSRLALTLRGMHHESNETEDEDMLDEAKYEYTKRSMKDSKYPKLDPENRNKTREPGYQTAGDLKNRMVVRRKEEKLGEGATCAECGATDCTGHPHPELDNSIKRQPGKKKKLLLGDKLKEDTLANQIAINYLANRLHERNSMISGEHDVGCNPPDYTGGMEVHKKPGGELQTDAKPLGAKSEKSKKQKYKYGEVKKKDVKKDKKK